MRRLSAVVSACVMVASSFPAEAQRTPAASADPDQTEITQFVLTSVKLDQFAAASKALMSLSQDRDQAEEAEPKTITDTVKRIEKHPTMLAAIQGAGLSPREYVVMGMTLMTTGLAVGMKRQGSLGMKDLPPSVSPGNAAFVEKNYEKIEALMKSLQPKEQ